MTKRKKAKVAKSTGKIDGRTREGKALKAKMQKGKRKVEKASEVKVKRKYTRKNVEAKTKGVESKPNYTPEELEKAKSYFNSARSQVRETVRQALQQVPKAQWNPTTHIVDGSMKVFNTLAVAAALGI